MSEHDHTEEDLQAVAERERVERVLASEATSREWSFIALVSCVAGIAAAAPFHGVAVLCALPVVIVIAVRLVVDHHGVRAADRKLQERKPYRLGDLDL